MAKFLPIFLGGGTDWAKWCTLLFHNFHRTKKTTTPLLFCRKLVLFQSNKNTSCFGVAQKLVCLFVWFCSSCSCICSTYCYFAFCSTYCSCFRCCCCSPITCFLGGRVIFPFFLPNPLLEISSFSFVFLGPCGPLSSGYFCGFIFLWFVLFLVLFCFLSFFLVFSPFLLSSSLFPLFIANSFANTF